MKAVFKTSQNRDPLKDKVLSFASGEAIFHEGDLGTDMFIIQDGIVEIVKKLGGETRTLSRLERGDFFGEMAILENVPRSADAIAKTDVRVIAINGSRFDEMIRKNPEISVRIMRKYSRRLRDANVLLQSLASDPKIDLENPILPVEPPPQNPPSAGSRHRLVDVATGNAFFFGLVPDTTIGRADPVTGIRPEIDLSSVDQQRSVSRRHAKLIQNEGSWAVLEEVGTVNGTFVNDERIPTGVPVPLHTGDNVRIGLIQMKVIFED